MSELTELAHRIGKEVIGPDAIDVDKHARFPKASIDALRKAKLLSAYVPKELGGMGVSIRDLTEICHVLGQYCSSSAMVYAMHQIQVVCIVRHGLESPAMREYLKNLVEHQYLIASVTSEVGVGGDVRSSLCALEDAGDRFKVEKNASVVSYGAEADALLLTARRTKDAPPNDQVLVLLEKKDTTMEKRGEWDTLGMRGTCSMPFLVSGTAKKDHILPLPYSEIASRTMVPFSHLVWTSLWSGIATDALRRARIFVQTEARKKLGTVPPGAIRLAEVNSMHQSLRAVIEDAIAEYERVKDNDDLLSSVRYTVRMNNLKVSVSQHIVQMVNHAMMICGIWGYKNDSKFSLGRHLRDVHGAGVMVNNDRLLGTNASLLLVHKEET